MTENNLIDRYVQAVGNLLGGKESDDIQLELRSTLQDMLEERGLDADNPAHEEQIAAMLKEYGRPDETATSYRPNRYLIGPRYYIIYTQVIRIVAAVVVGALTLATLVGGLGGDSFWQQFGHLINGYINGLIYSIGIVTLIFTVLERSGVAEDEIEAEINKEWDPRNLPVIEDRDRIDYFGMVMEMFFSIAFLVILNGAFAASGAISEFVQRWAFVGDILDALRPFFPWMITLLGVEIGLKFVVLLRGSWQRWSRWSEFAISVGNAVVMILFLNAAPYSDIAWLEAMMRISVLLALAINSAVGLGQLYRLIWPKKQPPWKALASK